MEIKYGNGQTKAGPGVSITLDGNDVAMAIDLWLQMNGVDAHGPRTIRINNTICRDVEAHVYVDASGYVIDMNEKRFNGSGIEEKPVVLKLVK